MCRICNRIKVYTPGTAVVKFSFNPAIFIFFFSLFGIKFFWKSINKRVNRIKFTVFYYPKILYSAIRVSYVSVNCTGRNNFILFRNCCKRNYRSISILINRNCNSCISIFISINICKYKAQIISFWGISIIKFSCIKTSNCPDAICYRNACIICTSNCICPLRCTMQFILKHRFVRIFRT